MSASVTVRPGDSYASPTSISSKYRRTSAMEADRIPRNSRGRSRRDGVPRRRSMGIVPTGAGSGEEGGGRLPEHGHATHLLVEERDHRPDLPVELLGDRLKMLVLHPDTIEDELRHVGAEGGAVQHHVDDHSADGDAELVEPADEARDHRDGERLREGDEEERGLAAVRQ